MIPRSDPRWHAARLGKLTASNMHKAMSLTKKGEPTELRNKYMADIVAERMTDCIVPHFVSDAMRWGIDHQAEAIAEFEISSGLVVSQEYFFQHPILEEFGATPDGLIGDGKVLEVKCPTTATHVRYCETRKIPIEYQYQMAAQCLCSNRYSGFFVSFDPRIKKSGRILILDFWPTKEFLDGVYEGAVKFLKETDDLFDKVTQA